MCFPDYLVKLFFLITAKKVKQQKVKIFPCYLLFFTFEHILEHLNVSAYLIYKLAFWSVHKYTRMTLSCWKQSFLFACGIFSGSIPQEVYYTERLQERHFHVNFCSTWRQIIAVIIYLIPWYHRFYKNLLLLVVFQIT